MQKSINLNTARKSYEELVFIYYDVWRKLIGDEKGYNKNSKNAWKKNFKFRFWYDDYAQNICMSVYHVCYMKALVIIKGLFRDFFQ